MKEVFSWIVENWSQVVVGLNALLGALIVIFAMIPGEQPEKAMKWIVDIIARLSKK